MLFFKYHPDGAIGVQLDSGKHFPRISRWAVTVLERVERPSDFAALDPKFGMSVLEILNWQQSFQVFFDEEKIQNVLEPRGEESNHFIQRLLTGNSEAGEESWYPGFNYFFMFISSYFYYCILQL